MIDYTSIAVSALASIAEAGTRIPISRVTTTTDPVTGDTTSTVTQAGELDVVILPAKKANALAGFTSGFDNAYIEALRAGRVRSLLIAASSASFEPIQGDHVVFAGATWSLLGSTPIAPAGVALIYKAEVSRL